MILASDPFVINRLMWISCVFMAGLSCRSTPHDYIQLEGKAQGTTFTVQYQDAFHRDFSSSIDSLFHVIDHSMSLWDTTSILSRINRNDTTAHPDDHFVKVFNASAEVSEKTSGAFDVTVGPIIRAWGFGTVKSGYLPDSAMLDSLKRIIGFRKVNLKNGVLHKEVPDIQLDFNAIAQGYTVDVLSLFLMEKGVQNYLVEVGGEVRAKGVNQRNTIWQVGIDKPLPTSGETRPLQTSLPLNNKSLATSGSYRKYIEQGGKRMGHIIDPVTGYPVQHQLVSVSVLAEDCMTADAYATAFLVMGMEKSMDLSKKLGLEIYCIYTDSTGINKTLATPGFPQ